VASSKWNHINVASGTAYILPVELHIFCQWNFIHSASGIAYIFASFHCVAIAELGGGSGPLAFVLWTGGCM